MIAVKKQVQKQESRMIYMEVYGVNRIIYRVTIGTAKRKGKEVSVYGVSLEDMRTGQSENLENFSEDIESTLKFTNDLIHKSVSPNGLYNEALRHLRFSSDYMLPM